MKNPYLDKEIDKSTICKRCQGKGLIDRKEYTRTGRARTYQEYCSKCGGSGQIVIKGCRERKEGCK